MAKNEKSIQGAGEINWDELEETKIYSEKEAKDLRDLYSSTLNTIEKNQIIEGTVVGFTAKDVVLDIGFKSDGLIGLNEFREDPELKEGDIVEVYVVDEEDKKGQLLLSRRNAKLVRGWESIVDSYNNNNIIEGTVICKTKGGLVAEVFGYECFLPGSQIDVKPIIDYDYYVGKKMEFKVVKINESIKNAVVSHKALIESELESQRQEIISKLEKGQVLEGLVKNITDFGAFIDLGGVDGLLYLSDISWGRISHPTEILELNQKLNVVVLDFDENKKRISLGLKQLEKHPWDTLDEKIELGSKVKGRVVNIEDYGAFLEIVAGVEGLVHVSEISWGLQPVNTKDYFKLNDTYEAFVVTLDKEERKMSLSIKQTTDDPWNKVENDYMEESKHTGKVINLTPYGAFLELEEGIGGLVHVSDFSWTKKIAHPSDVCKLGGDLEVVVLKIDRENRRLSLGHKQIEENPWGTFESVFPVGTVHQGTYVRNEEKDAIIALPYGLEAICFMRNLKKKEGDAVAIDEANDFMILEVNKDKKRILVSHTKVWEEVSSESRPSKKGGGKKTYKTSNIGEKSTLGDLEALTQLKEQMDGAVKEKAPKKKANAKKKED